MAFKTKLDACINRYQHQVKIMDAYLETVQEPLLKTKDKTIIQFAFESLAVRIIGFLEEYLWCLVTIATVHQEKLVRKYFTEFGNFDVQRQVQSHCNLGMLTNFAKSQVSFKEKAKKLKRIFDHLFSFLPFPDKKTENLILDLVLVRNIILHAGGWPNEYHADQIINLGIIVASREIDLKKDNSKPIKFYRLELTETRFLKEAVWAAGSIGSHIQEHLEKDLRYSYIKNQERI